MNVVGIALIASSVLRRWDFSEGKGEVVANTAPSDPMRLAVSGGPLGSLVIRHTTHWGDITQTVRRKNKGQWMDSEWTRGRTASKPSLLVGTHESGLFRAGIDGSELTNCFTFAFWCRVHDSTNRILKARFARMGNAWDDGFTLEGASYDHKVGLLSARFSHGKNAVGKVEFTDINAGGALKVGVWQFIAYAWDGRDVSIWVDGRRIATRPMSKPFKPIVFPGGWTEVCAFFEGNVKGRFRIGDEGPYSPFELDRFIVLDYAADADVQKSFMGDPTRGSETEQIAEAKADDAARMARDAISVSFPQDSAGFFRIGEKIPLEVIIRGVKALPAGWRLDVNVETLKGGAVPETTVVRTSTGVVCSFDRCDVYQVDYSLYDAQGNLVKRPFEPISVGILPPRPPKLDSPLGYWAMHEAFSYDSNIRRVCFDDWGKCPEKKEDWVGHRSILKRYDCYTRLQKVDKTDLRMYAFLPHYCSLAEKKIPDAERAILERKLNWIGEDCAALGIREFEVTSEVDGKTSPELYVENLKLIVPIIRKYVPDAIFYPPGATPCALPFINKILELGADRLSAGVSHHNYISNPVHWYRWSGLAERFHEVLDRYRGEDERPLKMFNTEAMMESLPRVYGRPMTREHARRCGYRVENVGGMEGFLTSAPTQPEEEAGWYQVQATLVNLLAGFETYVLCGSGFIDHHPNYRALATTAMSGQVLNGYLRSEEIKLPSLNSVCMKIFRKDGSNVVSLFGVEKAAFAFSAEPGKTYRTMDALGNYGSISASAGGVLSLESSPEPRYVFDVPESFSVIAPLALELPDEMPESGTMEGKLVIENPFKTDLVGELKGVAVRGMTVDLSERHVNLAPGGSREVVVRIGGKGLKKRAYPVRIELTGKGGDFIAERAFESKGVVRTIRPLAKPFALDGDMSKWAVIEPEYCDSEDDVVHGVPDRAQQWLPQWHNVDDLSLALRLAYCPNDAIYFLLEVKDDRVVPLPKGKNAPFLYDGLELFVDTRAGKALGAPVDDGADQYMISGSSSPSLEIPYGVAAKPDRVHVDVTAVSRKTAAGYLIEGRIVPNERCALRLKPGTQLLMDFLVDDTDEDEKLKLRKAAMAFHGTFDNNSQVSGWGKYELGIPER